MLNKCAQIFIRLKNKSIHDVCNYLKWIIFYSLLLYCYFRNFNCVQFVCTDILSFMYYRLGEILLRITRVLSIESEISQKCQHMMHSVFNQLILENQSALRGEAFARGWLEVASSVAEAGFC